MAEEPGWSVGPLTDAALEPASPDSGASKAEREWMERLDERDGGLLLLWAGAFKTDLGTPERPEPFGMTWHSLQFTDEETPAEDIVRTPAANVELMLSSLAHESRIRMMQELYDGPLASADLTERTGLRGGNLYYHLKELTYAHYVKQRDDGRYQLTHRGYQMLMTVTCLASEMVKDEGEKGLVVCGWATDE